jgi:hypothetical protein
MALRAWTPDTERGHAAIGVRSLRRAGRQTLDEPRRLSPRRGSRARAGQARACHLASSSVKGYALDFGGAPAASNEPPGAPFAAPGSAGRGSVTTGLLTVAAPPLAACAAGTCSALRWLCRHLQAGDQVVRVLQRSTTCPCRSVRQPARLALHSPLSRSPTRPELRQRRYILHAARSWERSPVQACSSGKGRSSAGVNAWPCSGAEPHVAERQVVKHERASPAATHALKRWRGPAAHAALPERHPSQQGNGHQLGTSICSICLHSLSGLAYICRLGQPSSPNQAPAPVSWPICPPHAGAKWGPVGATNSAESLQQQSASAGTRCITVTACAR